MSELDKTAWEVLNATADDCENLEQIYHQVCFELLPDGDQPTATGFCYRPAKGAPLLSAVADHIHYLVEQGLLEVVMDEEGRPWPGTRDLSYVWRAWFRMTPQGRKAWESSGHRMEQENTHEHPR